MDSIDREVLALRHFEHLSNEETAQVLGLSKSAASNRYIRAAEAGSRRSCQSIPWPEREALRLVRLAKAEGRRTSKFCSMEPGVHSGPRSAKARALGPRLRSHMAEPVFRGHSTCLGVDPSRRVSERAAKPSNRSPPCEQRFFRVGLFDSIESENRVQTHTAKEPVGRCARL